ncbi:SCO family protein [uncultured Planktosalinus sp.]|uniref:SCO family protein n=1 Tax=uncultured Planktosalinus sp. TaxID=1810935 RepID=UPI0030D77300|tara:strand:+ start:67 stop:735 length:669 start_codon:yes stop_codon:yes gene_type:complete
MLNFFAKYKFFAIVMLVLSAIIITAIYQILKPAPTLPVYQPTMVNSELVDSTKQWVKKYHTIADFSLANQNGDTITQKNYQDKIYIADFFFTTCPTICPIMTDNMLKLQEKLKDQDDVLLLSHTVTPEIDSVPVLKAYAEKKGVNDAKWNLVTGDKKHIYDLARKSYLVAKDEPYGGNYDMIHTENFVLVDAQKRIRGFYDGTNWEEMEELLEDLKILLREE